MRRDEEQGEKCHLNKILANETENVVYCGDFEIVISWDINIIMFSAMNRFWWVWARVSVHLHHLFCLNFGRESYALFISISQTISFSQVGKQFLFELWWCMHDKLYIYDGFRFSPPLFVRLLASIRLPVFHADVHLGCFVSTMPQISKQLNLSIWPNFVSIHKWSICVRQKFLICVWWIFVCV